MLIIVIPNEMYSDHRQTVDKHKELPIQKQL